ncbi:MAG: PLP-dependent aminotransferase family protein [Rubinisphaera brasiliensis]|uniref:aminotransferase-like domain-containing protein n=1 Tax=Rubinisphaera brasiliensis TaxID=119 RepID=UPI00391C3C5A
MHPTLSKRTDWAARQKIGYLMQQGVDHPDCLSLAAGLVDYGSLPAGITQTALEHVFKSDKAAQAALQYGTTAGARQLRKLLVDYLAQLENSTVDELQVSDENCLITTGSQQFLDLATQAILNPGDICLVTAPTYFVYLSTLEACGVETVSVECDDQGIIPASLDETLERLAASGDLTRVKMLYLVTYFDNPRGITLPTDRRVEVLEILAKWETRQFIYLLEDAAYRELWFDEPPPPSCYALAKNKQQVMVSHTFSKSLAPGLRTGWSIVPDALIKPITDLKSVHDFGSPHVAQILIADMLQTGAYAEHVAMLRRTYKAKADALFQGMQQELNDLDHFHVTRPDGGLYLWLTVPEDSGLDTRGDGILFERCVGEEQVMYVAGELFYSDRNHPEAHRTMRLSFGVQPEENLQEGARRLVNAIQACIPQT